MEITKIILEEQIFITDAGTAIIPNFIDGCPVTEIGPYACSGNQKVKSVFLPGTIEKIGAYAFYNCQELCYFSCSSAIRDLGAGVFTGCTNISRLDMREEPVGRSCLKEMLSEIRQTLRVNLYEHPDVYGCDNAAQLIFPEYYEEAIENTPARILQTHTHGCGHRYRYSVTREGVRFREYDSVFPHIQVQEQELLVTELALRRLQFPKGLAAGARSGYEEYLQSHLSAAVQVLASGKTDAMEWGIEEARRLGADCFPKSKGFAQQVLWLAEKFGKTEEDFNCMIEAAGRLGQAEALGILMDLSGKRFRARRRSFNL